MPPKYLETFDKRKNFVKFLLCFYFWNLFSFYCWGSVPTEVWRYLRESQSHPCCENIQRNDEIPFIPSHWAWNHQHTIFKHFSQLFLEKIWSNLRRQMIRWSIKSALPKYWLGHKEGSKVGFCLQQFLYIRHLFKMCLMYFLCVIISSHPFCASKRGWHFTQKKYSKYLEGDDWAPNIREESFLIQNLSQKMSTLKWDSFGGWMAQKLKIPLLCYQITQTSWHALSEDIGHRVRISNWCHHRSQVRKQNKMSFTPSYFEAVTSMAISSQPCF